MEITQNPLFMYAILLGLVTVMFFRVRQLESRLLMIDASVDAVLAEQTPGDFLPGIEARLQAMNQRVLQATELAARAAALRARGQPERVPIEELSDEASESASSASDSEAESAQRSGSDSAPETAAPHASPAPDATNATPSATEVLVTVEPRRRRSRRARGTEQ